MVRIMTLMGRTVFEIEDHCGQGVTTLASGVDREAATVCRGAACDIVAYGEGRDMTYDRVGKYSGSNSDDPFEQ